MKRKVCEYKLVTFAIDDFKVSGKLIDEDWEPWGSPIVIQVPVATATFSIACGTTEKIGQAFVRYSDV